MPAFFTVYTTTCCLAIACILLVGCEAGMQTDTAALQQEAKSASASTFPIPTTPLATSTSVVQSSTPISSVTPTSIAAQPRASRTTTPQATAQTLLRATMPTEALLVAPRAGKRPPTTQAGTQNAAALAAIQRAREDLAQRLGVTVDTIEVLSIQQGFKPTGVSDSPGKTNGWNIRLAAGDQAYRYQVDASGRLHRR